MQLLNPALNPQAMSDNRLLKILAAQASSHCGVAFAFAITKLDLRQENHHDQTPRPDHLRQRLHGSGHRREV
jgi:hypothetical protein